jgi:hypothetical protein
MKHHFDRPDWAGGQTLVNVTPERGPIQLGPFVDDFLIEDFAVGRPLSERVPEIVKNHCRAGTGGRAKNDSFHWNASAMGSLSVVK